MVKIVLTPEWFLGKDVMVDFLSFAVLLAFFALALRSYKVTNNRSLLYLGWGFGLISLAELASVITKLVLYYDIGPSQAIGDAIVTSHVLSSVDIFYYAGFFFYRFLTLCGLYMIYRLPRSSKSVGDYLLVVYFIFISAVLSKEFFYLFHITALFLSLMIVSNYIEIYRKNRFGNTVVLIGAFSMIALSQLLFISSKIDIFYMLASTFQALSYIVLLFLILRIIHGTKKKPYGDNIRHAGDNTGKKRKH